MRGLRSFFSLRKLRAWRERMSDRFRSSESLSAELQQLKSISEDEQTSDQKVRIILITDQLQKRGWQILK